MKIDYFLNEDDYINFNIYHSKNSDSIKKNLKMQRFIIPLSFFIFPFIAKLNTDIPLWYWFILFSISYIIWTLLYPKYYFYTIKKSASKILNEGKNEDLIGNKSIELREEDILSISDNSETKVRWNTVERYAQTDDYIFIYISAVSAYIIPTRAFANDEEREDFIEILNNKIAR